MSVKGTRQGPGQMTIGLTAPGMRNFHRAGLAGLWMTLEAIERDPELARRLRETGGTWERGTQEVVLRWEVESAPFLRALVEAAFQIDNHGLIYFPALGRPTDNLEHATVLQSAILGTFLQHGKTRGADASAKPGGVLAIGEEGERQLRYRRVQWYPHQRAAGAGSGRPPRWCEDPDATERLAGWAYPGGVERHVALGSHTKLAEPGWRYLALLFAPIGAFYFQLRARTDSRRPQFCVVLPELVDLELYARARRVFHSLPARDVVAAGGAEAALRVLALEEAEGLLPRLESARCAVVEFGTVAWSKQQKTRIALYEATPGVSAGFGCFKVINAVMPVRRIDLESGEWFWAVPQMPELVARNVLAGSSWWSGFAEFVSDASRRAAVLGQRGSQGERSGLATMVREGDDLFDGVERAFVEACHEAWRRRLGRLGDRSRREGISFRRLFEKEFEQQRLRLARCKNAATFRAAITDFWSRAGQGLPPLQDAWVELLPYLDERKWRAGRDLALLALASYSAPAAPEGGTTEDQGADDTQGEVT